MIRQKTKIWYMRLVQACNKLFNLALMKFVAYLSVCLQTHSTTESSTRLGRPIAQAN